jgi:DNA primase
VGLRAPVTSWTKKAVGDRIAWTDVKDRAQMVLVATNLMGPAQGRQGEKSSKNRWWLCPFHPDKNSSLCVKAKGHTWKCYGCEARGDAANLVMRLRNVGFREAVEWLAEFSGVISRTNTRSFNAKPQYPPVVRGSAAAEKPWSALSADQAAALIEESSRLLWEPAGREALAYLRKRGLEDDTIKAARLGWVDKLRLPKKDGSGTWPLSGVVLPWIDRDRPALVKVRRLGLVTGAKYIDVFRDRPILYPDRGAIRPGGTAIVCEGEFDCLLLNQELEALGVSIVTLGSASNSPAPEAIDLLCMASRLFIATDGDGAGDIAASKWPAHARRARPPAGDKDWSEVHAGGFNRIRYLWPGILCDHNWPRSPKEASTS